MFLVSIVVCVLVRLTRMLLSLSRSAVIFCASKFTCAIHLTLLINSRDCIVTIEP